MKKERKKREKREGGLSEGMGLYNTGGTWEGTTKRENGSGFREVDHLFLCEGNTKKKKE